MLFLFNTKTDGGGGEEEMFLKREKKKRLEHTIGPTNRSLENHTVFIRWSSSLAKVADLVGTDGLRVQGTASEDVSGRVGASSVRVDRWVALEVDIDYSVFKKSNRLAHDF